MAAGTGNLAELFRPGTLQQVGSPTVSTGGPVSNTGLALRRLGMKVRLMGKCGRDMFGRALLEALRAEAAGAEKGMKIVDGEDTSYTIVISPPGVDRMFLHCPGANDTFRAEDIDLDVVAAARLFHFGYPPLMASTYADGGAELVKIFSQAKSVATMTSLDMAYPDPAGPAGKVDWADILQKTLPYVDIFTPSVEELSFMLRRERFDELIERAAGGDVLACIDGELLGDLARQCLDAGAAVVLIKCGHLGLYVRTAERERFKTPSLADCVNGDDWAGRELFEPSYCVDSIVSATGAGDCAIAGFLASVLRGCSLDDALRYACATGAQNLSVPDAISGIRSWEQTADQVNSHPPKSKPAIPLAGWRFDAAQEHYVGPADRHNA